MRPPRTLLLALAVSAASVTSAVARVHGPFAPVQQPALPRIAVLDFSNGTPIDGASFGSLQRALSATLAGAVARSGRAKVMERNRMSALVAEQDLAKTGRVDDATAARVGRLLGVDYLLLGAFIVQPNGEMMVSTRLVDVATSTVSAGPEAIGDTKSATKLIGRLANDIARQLKWPKDTATGPRSNAKDSPELSASIDSLVRACEAKDPKRSAAARAAIEKRAPGHVALTAPCY